MIHSLKAIPFAAALALGAVVAPAQADTYDPAIGLDPAVKILRCVWGHDFVQHVVYGEPDIIIGAGGVITVRGREYRGPNYTVPIDMMVASGMCEVTVPTDEDQIETLTNISTLPQVIGLGLPSPVLY